jgi:RNA polymerase sigma-70 factor (ECF subfamily)
MTSAYNPETITLRNLDAEAIAKGLDELPADHREIIVLREMEGLAYKEIAEIMDIPIGTVMSRLARARKMLRDRLSDVLEADEPPSAARTKGVTP